MAWRSFLSDEAASDAVVARRFTYPGGIYDFLATFLFFFLDNITQMLLLVCSGGAVYDQTTVCTLFESQ